MSKKLLHTPEGVRDIYGEEYTKKLILQENLHKLLKLYGYRDIQTPTFEFFEVFSSNIGTTPSKELYKFFDKDGNTLVLRPDFTPSIARATAKYFMDEDVPIRFCYTGNAYANNSNLQGLLKETTQMGAELIGDASVEADAEMLSLVVECMQKAGLKDFQISVGQVEFFKGICDEAGIDEETEQELRDMISNKNCFGVEELLENLNLTSNVKEVILKITDMFGSIEDMREAKNIVNNKRSIEAIQRLEDLYEAVKTYGVEQYISFDLGMLSKYNYYTGVIFKAYTYGVGDAVIKGGRYDNLVKEFGKDTAAIGFAILVDQVLLALSRQKPDLIVGHESTLILYAADCKEPAISLTRYFRGQNMNIELMKIETGKTPEDYVAFAKRHYVGGILYFEQKDRIKVINIVTGEMNYASVAALTGEVN